MKIGFMKSPKSPDRKSPRLFNVVNYVCITFLACASFSAQAERIRKCHLEASISASGVDYNGNAIEVTFPNKSIPYYTVGRHGGIQANTARKRAVARFKKCAELLVNNPTTASKDINECNNSAVGSGAHGMSEKLGGESLSEKFVCTLMGSNSYNDDSAFFMDVKKLTVSGKTYGDKYCSSQVTKTASVQNISQWNCNNLHYDQYSLNEAVSDPIPIEYYKPPFIAMVYGIKDIMEILGSESDVEKIFGKGHQGKANTLLTMLEQAANNENTNALKEWMPRLSIFDMDGSEVLLYNGLPVNTADGTLPRLQAIYDRSDRAIFISNQPFIDFYSGEEMARCTMVQAMAHHVSHYFDGFNGSKQDLTGSEGTLAALRICNPSLFENLTDNQITALQREADYADVRFHGKYVLNDVELSFWTPSEGVLSLAALLPAAAETLLDAPVVTVAGTELVLEELSNTAQISLDQNEMLVVDSSGGANAVGTSEAIAAANETLTAVAVLGRQYDANYLHDFNGSQLNLAHLHLHAAGYRFVGYRWEQTAIAQDMVNKGVVRIAQPEYEQSDDNYTNRRQWRGLNVSEDIGMARDYSEPGIGNPGQPGRMLRVYLPSEEVNRLYNFEPYLNTPEADSAARELIGSDIDLSNVTDLDQSYLMRGRARDGYGYENDVYDYVNDVYELIDYTETFISWALADRAIVIPAVRQIDLGTSELEVLNGASSWEEEVPRVSGRSDIVQ